MAAISVSLSRGASESDLGQAGAQTVTLGTNAPAAGDVEIRFSNASLTAGLTTREAKELIEILWRFLIGGYIQDGSAVWPNL